MTYNNYEKEFGLEKTTDDNENNDSIPIILRPINDRQKVVIETITMRLSTKEALTYLHDHGFPIKEATYYRDKAKLEKMKMERLFLKAKVGFIDQHLQRIDSLEIIEKKMWQEFIREANPFKRVQILKDIAQMQPYLSAYYEATKYIADSRSDKIGSDRGQAIFNLSQKNNSLHPVDEKELINNYGNQTNNPEKLIGEREERFKEVKDRVRRMREQAVF